jgi:hypothetical protein
VIALVKRVGNRQLLFTVADVRSEMEAVPRLQLTHSSDLWRHLKKLNGDLIEEVARRDFGQAGGRSKKKYVLRSRRGELRSGQSLADIDDLERVYFAVWIAFLCNESRPVPTRLVTSVVNEIEPLALNRQAPARSILQSLAERTPPVIERIPPSCAPWVRWVPLGRSPEHPEFQRWLAAFRERISQGRALTGQATLTEVGRELLRLTIRASRSSRYPHGRPATVHDVRAFAGENAQGAALAESIRRRNRTIAQVICDAARETVNGLARVDVRIARVVAPLSGASFYDIPDEPGFEERQATVALLDLREALQSGALEAIEEEVRRARALEQVYRGTGVQLEGLIVARAVLARREFERLENVLSQVERYRGAFSSAVRDEVDRHRATLNRFLERNIWFGDEDEVLERACAALNVSPESVLDAPRPLVGADEYWSWFPESYTRTYTPADLINLARSLRRFPNPLYTHPRDKRPGRAYRHCVDRVEALTYAAGRLMASTAPALEAGARLLGRNLRSGTLVRRVGESATPRYRADTVAALILLGQNPREIAWGLLSDRRTPSPVIADVIRLMYLVPDWDPSTLPLHIRTTHDWSIARAVHDVMLARTQGRRIV